MFDVNEKHPKWTPENINHALKPSNSYDRIQAEVLLSAPCVKCGNEMGEHPFVFDWIGSGKFVCPVYPEKGGD